MSIVPIFCQLLHLSVGLPLKLGEHASWLGRTGTTDGMKIRTLDDLERLLERHPDEKEGNRQIAQYLWGNNHWTRVQWPPASAQPPPVKGVRQN
jgi:hypothetical protein